VQDKEPNMTHSVIPYACITNNLFYQLGKVLAQPNGGFEGEAKFKLRFKSGGAIDFGTAMLKAAQMGKKLGFIYLISHTYIT
jgi:hypothetical protein